MVERREGVEHSDRASYVKRVGRSWVDGGTEKWLSGGNTWACRGSVLDS